MLINMPNINLLFPFYTQLVFRMTLSISLIDSSFESLYLVVYHSVVYLVKGYLAFYVLCCCHELIEDPNEGTVNAREKWTNALISSLMLALTFVGLYGIFSSHFGLFLTWLLLKPVVRILELEVSFLL